MTAKENIRRNNNGGHSKSTQEFPGSLAFALTMTDRNDGTTTPATASSRSILAKVGVQFGVFLQQYPKPV
jgi:hypothetical protein